MSQNICNICGANYEYHNGRWICPACGAYKAEELSNEEVTLLYNAAQKLRLSDFDEAEKAYADIIEKFPKNPDGYWGRLLSRYGIKYEEDFDGRKIPTCYATSIESVITDKDYLKATELADQETRAYYTLQAEYIERVRKEWVEKARKEKPYDIFICYKDSDLANGIERTQDSIAAQELYIHLTEQGYRVFFSRESLRGKVGEKYEPYIFNALSTAKVLLVYGSKSEYITSTWLKNEWTRYEKRLQAGEKKPNSLIVACDGFSPSELPKVLSSMQCFDATSRSFYTDLDAVLKKIIKGEEKPKPVVTEKPEKKKSKALPFTIAALFVVIAILLGIVLPNLLGDKAYASITDSKHGVIISADSKIFDKNTSVIVDKLTDGAQYNSLVLTVNNAKSVDLQNAIIYDIECDVDITKNVTIKVAYSKSATDSTVKVYYVSDDKNLIEEHSCIYDDGFVEFKTSHLSYYVIGEIIKDNTGTPEKCTHIEVIDEAVAPTCTETGLTEGKHCGICDEILVAQEIVPALNHPDIIEAGYEAPTCTQTGLTNWVHCSACNTYLQEQTIIPALGHTYDDEYDKVCNVCGYFLQCEHNNLRDGTPIPPTCDEPGLTAGKFCVDCEDIVEAQETIPALGHNEVIDEAVAPTCINTGLTEGKHCDVCNEILVKQNILPASEACHDWLGEWTIVRDATCTESGAMYLICSICQDMIATEGIFPLGHTEVIDEAVAPTYTETGLTEGMHCSVCGEVLIPQETIPALHEHNYTSTITPPTATEDGYTTYICVCGDTYTEAIIPTDFTVTSSNREKVGYKGITGENLVIPAVFENKGTWYRVVAIGDDAFSYCSLVNSVVIPESVTTIGNRAFFGCHAYDLTIPSSVTSIGNYAFYGVQMTSIAIPSGVTTIAPSAFGNCNLLTSITIPSSVTNIGEAAFRDCKALKNITFSENSQLTSIGEEAFMNCRKLTNITIPNSVTNIGKSAFWGCSALKSIVIPDGVTKIEENTFYECTNLSWVVIPDSVTAISSYAFYYCNCLGKAYYGSVGSVLILNGIGINNTDLTTASRYYYRETQPTDTTYEYWHYVDGVPTVWHVHTEVIDEAVSPTCTKTGLTEGKHCSACNEVLVAQEIIPALGGEHNYIPTATPPTATEDGYTTYTCSYCGDTYTETIIPSDFTVTSLNRDMVGYDVREENLVIPVAFENNGTWYRVVAIGGSAFQDCINLISVVIPDSVKTIGIAAFMYCYSLESVVIPEGVTSIGDRAFNCCPADLTIPNSVTSIGDSAFVGCKMTSVTIPSGVTTIAPSTFHSCDALTSITIPSSVTSIGENAFRDCESLKTITFSENSQLASIESGAFANCSSLSSIVIPASCHTIESYAFSHSPNLVIYCESPSKPYGWGTNWYGTKCTVYWGYLRNGYKVEFDYDQATGNKSVTYMFVEVGTSYTLPVPTKTGYTFNGWYYGDTQVTNAAGTTLSAWNIESDCNLKAKWDPSTNTVYTVKHYLENVNDSGYTLQETQTLYGTTNSSVFPDTKVYTGFDAPSIASVTILPDGSAVLEYRYTRTTYTVTFVTNGGNVIDAMTVKYQQTITLPNAVRNGFTFGGWFTDVTQNNSITSCTVQDNLTVYAWWQEETKASKFNYEGISEIKITGYHGHMSEVVIPSYIGGMPVVEIAAQAFQDNSSSNLNTSAIVSITIPETVKKLGANAFHACQSLRYVTLPNNLIEIGTKCFSYCKSLENIEIPDSVSVIGAYAFEQCDKLGNVTLPNNLLKVETGIFDSTNVTALRIPSMVQEIESYGLSNCYNLKEVYIPSSVLKIGSNAMPSYGVVIYCEAETQPVGWDTNWRLWTYDCNIKTYWNYYGSVSDDDFKYAVKNDNSCYIMEYIGTSENVTIPNNVDGHIVNEIGDEAFANKTAIKTIVIPSHIVKIGSCAFLNCSGLSEIIIPEAVEIMGHQVFKGCAMTIKCEILSKPDTWEYDWSPEPTEVCPIQWYCYGDIWDGTTSYSFAGGSGTEQDPYLISTAEQLAYVATSVNQGVDTFKGKYLKLTTNIHLMSLEWTPIGNATYAFEGNFDGDGYSIIGLSVTKSTLKYGGLFGKVQDSSISNLTMNEAYVKTQATYCNVGILLGYGYSSTDSVRISNCDISGEVNTIQCGFVGGIVGVIFGEVSNSRFSGIVYGSAYNAGATIGVHSTVDVGGIAGRATTITDCYTEGELYGSGGSMYYHRSYVGGIAGSAGTVRNCYSITDISSSGQEYSYAGGIVARALYPSVTIENCFCAGNITGTSYSSSDAFCGRIIAEDNETNSITNCHADSSKTITKDSTSYASLQFTQTLQSENFIYNTLGWSSDIWQINEGGFPTLK